MKMDQKFPANEINAQISSNLQSDEPKSAHATSTVEKYVEKRKKKAEKQSEKEHKAGWDFSALKYVIL